VSATARWNLVVSQKTDDALRQVLASEGRARKGELSRFVEDAVRARIIEVEAEAVKRANAGRTEAEIANAVEEALEWARRR
jgi:DNA-directed RNA polymerase subunit E'/Rpb7